MQNTINLKTTLIEPLSLFEEILNHNHKEHSYEIHREYIDQNFLPDEIRVGLNTIKSSALYWFGAETIAQAQQLKKELEYFRENGSKTLERAIPAKNKYENNNSKVLYVGVRQGGERKHDGLSNISGRIHQHIGCYEKGSTQSLQLHYWAKQPLTLHVIALNNVDNDYLYILEKLFAIKLKPLCGRH